MVEQRRAKGPRRVGQKRGGGLPDMASASCMVVSIDILLAFAGSQQVDDVPQGRVPTGAEHAPYALYVPARSRAMEAKIQYGWP
jgi:hypothetical protein